MEVNVAKELKLAGSVGAAHIEQQIEPFEYVGRLLEFTEPLVADVTYSFDGEGFSVNGSFSSALRMNCTKCNTLFIQPFSLSFAERFLKVSEQEAEELDCYSFVGETLKLDKMVMDLLMLNAPQYGLCRPDCRGLCPVCGTNLNITQCSCSSAAENNAFASLKELAQLLKED